MGKVNNNIFPGSHDDNCTQDTLGLSIYEVCGLCEGTFSQHNVDRPFSADFSVSSSLIQKRRDEHQTV